MSTGAVGGAVPASAVPASAVLASATPATLATLAKARALAVARVSSAALLAEKKGKEVQENKGNEVQENKGNGVQDEEQQAEQEEQEKDDQEAASSLLELIDAAVRQQSVCVERQMFAKAEGWLQKVKLRLAAVENASNQSAKVALQAEKQAARSALLAKRAADRVAATGAATGAATRAAGRGVVAGVEAGAEAGVVAGARSLKERRRGGVVSEEVSGLEASLQEDSSTRGNASVEHEESCFAESGSEESILSEQHANQHEVQSAQVQVHSAPQKRRADQMTQAGKLQAGTLQAGNLQAGKSRVPRNSRDSRDRQQEQPQDQQHVQVQGDIAVQCAVKRAKKCTTKARLSTTTGSTTTGSTTTGSTTGSTTAAPPTVPRNTGSLGHPRPPPMRSSARRVPGTKLNEETRAAVACYRFTALLTTEIDRLFGVPRKTLTRYVADSCSPESKAFNLYFGPAGKPFRRIPTLLTSQFASKLGSDLGSEPELGCELGSDLGSDLGSEPDLGSDLGSKPVLTRLDSAEPVTGQVSGLVTGSDLAQPVSSLEQGEFIVDLCDRALADRSRRPRNRTLEQDVARLAQDDMPVLVKQNMQAIIAMLKAHDSGCDSSGDCGGDCGAHACDSGGDKGGDKGGDCVVKAKTNTRTNTRTKGGTGTRAKRSSSSSSSSKGGTKTKSQEVQEEVRKEVQEEVLVQKVQEVQQIQVQDV